jgi:hypothetical protein
MSSPTAPTAFQRVLAVCPVFVALLWVAGIAHFRALEIEPVEWAVVAAAAFALHLLTRRASRPTPLPKLPPDTQPAQLAMLAATLVAVLAAALGGLVEALVEGSPPCPTPWTLRTLWHAACAFAASYCNFLLRVQRALQRQQQGPPPPNAPPS